VRITLAIDDDVLTAAKEMAVVENRTVGKVISSLARQGLTSVKSRRKTRNGVPILPIRSGASRVTANAVGELREELP
jgi:hypothetical protein